MSRLQKKSAQAPAGSPARGRRGDDEDGGELWTDERVAGALGLAVETVADLRASVCTAAADTVTQWSDLAWTNFGSTEIAAAARIGADAPAANRRFHPNRYPGAIENALKQGRASHDSDADHADNHGKDDKHEMGLGIENPDLW